MTYQCPVCHSPDATAYLRCNWPDCTDGRDPRPTISGRVPRSPAMQPRREQPVFVPCHCGLMDGSCTCKSQSFAHADYSEIEKRVMAHYCEPDDDTITLLRQQINDRYNFFRGLKNGALISSVLWVLIIGGILFLSGCVTVIGPCPEGQCIGPYDLTLSSHRQALD